MENRESCRVIFAAAVQNCAVYLPDVFKNIENLSSCFAEVAYIFVENDSIDSTKNLLRSWGDDKSNCYLVNLDGLKTISARTVRLEIARNAYLETVRYYQKFKAFDYLIVLDLDDAGVYPVNKQQVLDAINFLNNSPTRAAAFANQKGTYYDMWALRLKTQCPTDVWEEVLDHVINHNCSDEVAFSETFKKRIFSIDQSSGPIKVDSAFGGLGIYKMKYVLGNSNPYIGSKVKIVRLNDGKKFYARWQVCEHVHFHRGIKNQGGELFIYPKLINGSNFGLSFPPSAFRGMLFN